MQICKSCVKPFEPIEHNRMPGRHVRCHSCIAKDLNTKLVAARRAKGFCQLCDAEAVLGTMSVCPGCYITALDQHPLIFDTDAGWMRG